jgi:hypothetical protein
MAANGNGKAPALTEEERHEVATRAHAALGKANTRKQVADVWSEFYLVLGHRVLGRLVLGQDVDAALRRKRAKAAAA